MSWFFMDDIHSSRLPRLEGIEFGSPHGLRFAEYWFSLPKQDLIPSRGDFDPAALAEILPYILANEIVSPEMIVQRLIGTKVVEDLGFDSTGKNYLDLVAPARRLKASLAMRLMADHPCGMHARVLVETAAGRNLVSDATGFPMRDNDGRANLVYLLSHATPMAEYRDAGADPFKAIDVSSRKYIDIGAGIPDFQD